MTMSGPCPESLELRRDLSICPFCLLVVKLCVALDINQSEYIWKDTCLLAVTYTLYSQLSASSCHPSLCLFPWQGGPLVGLACPIWVLEWQLNYLNAGKRPGVLPLRWATMDQLVQDQPRCWVNQTGPHTTSLLQSMVLVQTDPDQFFCIKFIVPI